MTVNASSAASSAATFPTFMLDGRIVEALLEIIERGFYILSVALAWGEGAR